MKILSRSLIKKYLQLLSFGLFIQETSKKHIEAVHFLWKVLYKKNTYQYTLFFYANQTSKLTLRSSSFWIWEPSLANSDFMALAAAAELAPWKSYDNTCQNHFWFTCLFMHTYKSRQCMRMVTIVTNSRWLSSKGHGYVFFIIIGTKTKKKRVSWKRD